MIPNQWIKSSLVLLETLLLIHLFIIETDVLSKTLTSQMLLSKEKIE